MPDLGFWAGFGLGAAFMACYWYFVVDQPQVRRWAAARESYNRLLEEHERRAGLRP